MLRHDNTARDFGLINSVKPCVLRSICNVIKTVYNFFIEPFILYFKIHLMIMSNHLCNWLGEIWKFLNTYINVVNEIDWYHLLYNLKVFEVSKKQFDMLPTKNKETAVHKVMIAFVVVLCNVVV